jgi:tRNA threonylcarbamoyladenosine biosynthesis protein TsaE
MIVATQTEEQTRQAGRNFGKQLGTGGVVCLYGEQGAGKTVFAQGIARGLGIKQRVISPTFVLVRRYIIPRAHEIIDHSSGIIDRKIEKRKRGDGDGRYLWHVDLYRLQDSNEARAMGIGEILARGTEGDIVLIEWAEKIASLLPRPRWEIYIKPKSEGTRRVCMRYSK